MKNYRFTILSRLVLGLSLLIISVSGTVLANIKPSKTIPNPATDIPLSQAKGKQTAVFAGGCFWGMEAVFEHLKGVSDVVSGFSGGTVTTASYDKVSSGMTEHAESVRIIYDPTQISYGQLLKVYFSVAHDPTQLNRQGPDSGKQYRSAIFFTNNDQKKASQNYIKQLNKAGIFQGKIVTEVLPFKGFYPAESYHQNFVKNNPNYPYIVINDLPKLEQLKKQFPDIYKP